jgi:nitroimidazol reductase NimA-like FMN-containing flavoprotein (pyridoxamine 5'-phosphate oxidase superfamily)
VANIRLSPEEAWALLEEQRVGIFSSLRQEGTPISLPVWYAPIDRRIYLRGPAKSKKFTRVRNNPRVSFLCETGERWVELRAVHLTGTAQVITDESVEREVTTHFDQRYAALRPPRAELPDSARAQYRGFAVIEITPDERFLSWDNSKLGGTPT